MFQPDDKESTAKPSDPPNFPLVCIGGASADIDSYTGIIGHLRADLGIAVVVVNHLTMVAGLLLEALPRCTQMPVQLIIEGSIVRPNCVYILEEERDLHVVDGVFHLAPVSKPTGWPNLVSIFLNSLSSNWRGKSVAVILSGYDGDGASALLGIRKAGGITIAQQAETAGQPDMPLSAIASGNVDYILSIEGIASEIERIALAAKPNAPTPPNS
jgi:chemotaxis response regulator CheB